MIVIPAIDLMDGRCVRLIKGQKENVIRYVKDPLEIAENYIQQGAKIIHVIDLDGAFTGEMKNIEIIAKLAKRFPIQVGGGIRSEDKIKELLELGVKKVIVSTLLLKDQKIAAKLKQKYYGKLVGSFDFKDGKLSYAGWIKQSEYSFEQIVQGLAEIVVTDTSKDGTFQGPNIELLKELMKKTDARIISAGGVRDLADLEKLSGIKIYGAIAGRAFLEGKITIEKFEL